MTAKRLLGKPVAESLRAQSAERIAALRDQRDRAPGLAILSFGDDPAADRYFRQIERQGRTVGLDVTTRLVDPGAGQAAAEAALADLNRDPAVDGILIQFPVPAGLDGARIADLIDPAKDADGISPRNLGRLALGRPAPAPNTARAGIAVLDHYEIAVTGRRIVIVGRSPIVGRPLGYLLLGRDATITFCHTKTRDLPSVTRTAEILLVATGRPGLIDGAAVAPGAIVLDFGTTVADDGRLVGDVDAASVAAIAGALTPVPGGIGPVTTACLLATVVDLAEQRATTSA